MTDQQVEKAILVGNFRGEKCGVAVLECYMRHRGGLSLQMDTLWEGAVRLGARSYQVYKKAHWCQVLEDLRRIGEDHFLNADSASGLLLWQLAETWDQVFIGKGDPDVPWDDQPALECHWRHVLIIEPDDDEPWLMRSGCDRLTPTPI